MPQTVIKLKYTTARRICKAIFRQAPRAAVFRTIGEGAPRHARAALPNARNNCLYGRRRSVFLLVSGFRAISITGTGIPPTVACGSGRGSRELSERRNARPAFASASLKRMRREAGTRFREPLNQSSAALSGPFCPKLIGLKILKYVKDSCDFQTSIWNKIPR